MFCFFFSSRRRHTRSDRDWSSDVCSSDLEGPRALGARRRQAIEFLDLREAHIDDRLTRAAQRDRKSTRLNSSHDQISYAVFCLKKKKILAYSLLIGFHLANEMRYMS